MKYCDMTPEQEAKTRAYLRGYYEKNKAAYRARTRKWKKENPEKYSIIQGRSQKKRYISKLKGTEEYRKSCRIYTKKWREKNPEKNSESVRLSNRKRSESGKAREWFQKNKNRIRKRHRERSESDIQYVLSRACRTRIWCALSRKKIKKSRRTESLIGCSVDFLKGYLEARFRDGMSWENRGSNGWHVDHITPCSSFDLNDPLQMGKCFHYTNLQPLWWWENLSKSDKIIPITQAA